VSPANLCKDLPDAEHHLAVFEFTVEDVNSPSKMR